MLENFDFLLLDKIALLKCDAFDWFFSHFTHLGDGGIIWIAIALLCLCFKKTRKTGFRIALALILGALIANVTLKPLVARLRPFQIRNVDILIPHPSDFSFPSGHTVSSFAASFAIFRSNKKRGTMALIFATLIAFSRLYLYVHFPSDVFSGVVIGLVCGYVSDKIINKIYSHR